MSKTSVGQVVIYCWHFSGTFFHLSKRQWEAEQGHDSEMATAINPFVHWPFLVLCTELMPTEEPSHSLKVILENKEGKCERKWQTSSKKWSMCQTLILENITNWEFPKKVKVDLVFLRGYSNMCYEKTLNQKCNGTVSQGIFRNHHWGTTTCLSMDSAPLLLNSFTNTSDIS